MRQRIIPLAVLLLLGLPLQADVITLKDKTRLTGRILEEGEDSIKFEAYDRGPVSIDKDRILSVRKGKSHLDAYDKKAGDVEDTADGHYALGKWCKSRKLFWRADLHWRKALEFDPDHAKAHKELGHVQVDGDWLTEEEYKTSKGYVKFQGKWVKKSVLEKMRMANAVAITQKVAVKPNADRKWLEGLKERMQEAAESWWKCTEGQMYLSKVHIVDNSTDGDVVLHNLDSMKWLPGKEYGRVQNGTTIYLGGKFLMVTYCHEMGHRYFNLPEEYVGERCKHCVMDPWNGLLKFCDGSNHTGQGEDCWTRILKIHKKWKYPNKGYGKCPQVQFTIEDN